MDEIKTRVNKVFRKVFEDDSLNIEMETCSDDIPGWNSLAHINLLAMIEKEFDIRFDIDQIITFENVGDICKAIETLYSGD
ncbi:MAG: acyl carrier protein [Lachnospiraceae bacterium]|nr:acyl carrier protein [Lachnospiraceae bacterium]